MTCTPCPGMRIWCSKWGWATIMCMTARGIEGEFLCHLDRYEMWKHAGYSTVPWMIADRMPGEHNWSVEGEKGTPVDNMRKHLEEVLADTQEVVDGPTLREALRKGRVNDRM